MDGSRRCRPHRPSGPAGLRATGRFMAGDAKLSRNETLVLDALRGDTAPQTAYQLLDRLRGDGLKAPLQIYRALRSLSDRHLVHRLESLNAFVACAHGHGEVEPCRHAAAFAICERCGCVAELPAGDLDRHIETLAGSGSFAVHSALVEIRGLCGTCVTGTGA